MKGEDAFYIFNATDNDGFVIVSGSEELPEVLGWSDQGSIDPGNMPDGLKWLLSYYEQIVRSRRFIHKQHNPGQGSSAHSLLAPSRSARKAVEPLLKTSWSQWAPYNNLCPEYNGKRCLTGCVATALAQVINYNRWPEGATSAVEQLITQSHQLRLPRLEPTTFDWNDMNTDDIARLMLYCGQAVGMDYDPEASGAIPTEEVTALRRVFGYSRDTRFVYCSDYSSDKWEELLHNELAANRPIIYNGYTTKDEGHTFVLHGYKDGLFYVNWGWGGQGDGYFALTNLDSGNGIYSQWQCATIGIHSSVNDPVETAKAEVAYLSCNESRYYSFYDNGEAYLWVGGNLRSAVPTPVTLQIGIGLFDLNDQLLKVLWQGEQEYLSGEAYWFSADFTLNHDVAPGTYHVMSISRGSDAEPWEANRGSFENYVEMTVFESLVKMRCFPLNDLERETVDLGIQTIDGYTYDLYTQRGKNYALVLPAAEGRYKGDIWLPDAVNYDGKTYILHKAIDAAFGYNEELTSLSTSMYYAPYIGNSDNITKYELREGVTRMEFELIHDGLEEVTFPSTLVSVYGGALYFSPKLKTIRFNSTRPFTMMSYPKWSEESMPALRDVYFLTDNPPTITWMDGEFKVNPKVSIHIPKGSLSNWQDSPWYGWNFVEDQESVFNGIEWGYNTHNEMDGQYVPFSMGDNDGEYAIRIPSEVLEPLKGNTISSIRFNTCYLGYDYFFITSPGKDYIVKQLVDIAPYNTDWNTVPLDNPLVITGEELYVGVGRYGIISTFFSTADELSNDGFYMRAMGSGEGVSPQIVGNFVNMTESFPGNLPIRIVITGDHFPTDIQLSDFQAFTTEDPVRLTAKVTNRTSKEITKYTVSWAVDGKNQQTTTVKTQLKPGKNEILTIKLPAIKGKTHSFSYSVSDIDGQPDAVASNSTGTYNFKLPTTTYFPRRVVMEEATGTWCGWCVRGLETISRLSKEYPKNFIAIGIHNEDPMANWLNYDRIADNFSAYPYCTINRQNYLDPDYPTIRQMVEAQKASAEADIQATAQFASADSSAVTVTTSTTFGFSEVGTCDYRIAYVVVEDNVGPYSQKNFYSGQEMDASDYMYDWGQLPGALQYTFDDVARAVYTDANGLKGSIPTIIEEGKAYNHTYGFNLPNNILSRDHIRIVTLLIDNTTGEILNAAETTVVKPAKLVEHTFALSYRGEQLPDYANITVEADEDGYGEVTAQTTTDTDGLYITSLDGSPMQGEATLELLGSNLDAELMKWNMGGETLELTTQQPKLTTTFSTGSNGQLPVHFNVRKIKAYGSLEARLTVTIGGDTRQAIIQVVNDVPVVKPTNLLFREQTLYTGKRYTSDDFADITSGSFKIASNGRTVTLYDLVTNSDMQEGCLFDFYDDVTLILNGTNTLNTQGHVVISPRKNLTITGKGTLTTQSTWYDFWVHGNDLTFDNTSITCKGYTAIGNNMMPCGDNLVVNHSTFKGSNLFRLSSLVLIGCHFDSPRNIVCGTTEEGGIQLQYEDGEQVHEFTILPFEGNYENVVQPSSFGKVYLETNKRRTIDVTCQNSGTETVKSVSYVLDIDGSTETVQTYTLATPVSRIGGTFILPLTLTGDAQAGISNAKLTITKVNGQPNDAKDPTAMGTLITVGPAASHRVVVEEFTGTWCQWCTRGIVGLDMLNTHFGDQVVTVAVHSGDPMQCGAYDFIMYRVNGFPSCVINRGATVDPYWGSDEGRKPFGIADDVNELLSQPVVASIEAKAWWADKAQNSIKVTTQTTFGVDFTPTADTPAPTYQIGYILVADGLKGKGSEWAQHNVYSNMGSGDPNLQPIESLPQLITNMVYDHVGIGAWGGNKGIEGSIAMPIEKDKTQTFTYICDNTDNPLVQDKSRLTMVALLLDAETRTVINAAKCEISEYTGIDDLNGNQTPDDSYIPVYDLQGRQVNRQAVNNGSLPKGIYVTGGRKVVVK